MPIRILIAEDDPHVQKLLAHSIAPEGWTTEFCASAEEVRPRLKEGFDLFIFDWMLQGPLSGLELCKEVRSQTTTPILMLTARSTPFDIVAGLESGADDYLTKPFEAPVLLARLRALLRRRGAAPTPQHSTLKISDLEIFPEKFEVRRGKTAIELTASEFKILIAMIEARGGVLSRKKLLSRIQEQGVTVVDRIIDTHVYALRKKLGSSGDFIETVRGVGYRIRD